MPVFHMLPDEANTIADYIVDRVSRRHAGRYDASFTPRKRGGDRSFTGNSDARLPSAGHAGGSRPGAVQHRRAAEARLDGGVAYEATELQAGNAAAGLRAVDCGCAGADGVPEQPRIRDRADTRSGGTMRAPLARVDSREACWRSCASADCGPGPAAAGRSAARRHSRRGACGALSYAEGQGSICSQQYCATCHGDEGKGDGQNASNLNPPPPDMTASKNTRDAALLAKGHRAGQRRGRPLASVTAVGARLSHQQIDYLVAYCQSLAREKP